MAVATSFAVPNYSGMLFNKGNTKTPFSTMIGAKQLVTDHVEFATGQEFTTATGTQPNISENDSLTAPTPTFVGRSQETNVTQIFHETYGVSYAKESNMGTLSGLNVAGQVANPIREEDFQAAAKMAKIAQDIEYTFINGTFNKATTDAQANKTRGLLTAIGTNVLAAGGKALDYWMVMELIAMIDDANAPTDGLVLGLSKTQIFQLNADADQNGLTIVPNSRNVNGINITTIQTPYGDIDVANMKYLPSGVATLFNPGVCRPVHQMTPGKGNFFVEELAKTGAGTTKQIFGQIGLDYGAEWYHAKITGLKTTYDKPEYKFKVAIAE